jgi:hypothetical protein
VSEMRLVEHRDVDLENNVIRLRPEISKNKKGRVLPLRGALGEIIARAAENRRLDLHAGIPDKGEPVGDFRRRGITHALPLASASLRRPAKAGRKSTPGC